MGKGFVAGKGQTKNIVMKAIGADMSLGLIINMDKCYGKAHPYNKKSARHSGRMGRFANFLADGAQGSDERGDLA